MISEFTKNYKNKRFLITGAGGYIGNHLVAALSGINCHILRFNRKPLAQKKCTATIEDIQADLTEFDDWLNLLKNVDYIFHLAAQTGIKTADNDPIKDAKTNVIGTLKILEAVKKNNHNAVFVLAGTVTQCGLKDSLMVHESLSDEPITLYELNKLIVEKYLKYFCEKKWLHGTCLRLSNVYGPGVQSSSSSRGVLNQIVCNALLGKEIISFGSGEFIRDYTYIQDVVNAFLLAGIYINRLPQSYYVIGTGQGTTINNAFDLAAKLVHEKSGITVSRSNQPLPRDISPIDLRNAIVDSSAFSRATGWQARYSLEQGLREMISILTAEQHNLLHSVV